MTVATTRPGQAVAAVNRVFIHPAAICESADIGRGTHVWAFAHVMAGAVVGRDCNIGDHAFIESGAVVGDGVTVKNHVMIWDGVRIEDNVFLGPGMTFTNDRYPRSRHVAEAAEKYRRKADWLVGTTVREGASIGAGAIIICGAVIGSYATIAAGAVVTHDVPDYRLIVGQPGHIAGWVCRCGAPLTPELACFQCGRRYALDRDTLMAID